MRSTSQRTKFLTEIEGRCLRTLVRATLGRKSLRWDRGPNLPELAQLIVYAGVEPPVPDRDYEAALVAGYYLSLVSGGPLDHVDREEAEI